MNTYLAAFAGLPREVWIQGLATLVNRNGMMVLPFTNSMAATRVPVAVADVTGGVQPRREE